jgi:acetyl-CoA acetyltransferase
MPRHPLRAATAIAGLGLTPQGKVYGNSAIGFAVDAVEAALADAGLERSALDGLLVNPGLTWGDLGMGSFQLQQAMGLRDLRLSATMNLGGATASAMTPRKPSPPGSARPSPASSRTRR